MSQRSHGPCQACGSLDVIQIRTVRCDVLMEVNGAKIRFCRLYLERCNECREIVLYGKAYLGAFHKTYLPGPRASGVSCRD